MLFPTATFAIFFLAVLPLSWLTMPRPHRWRPFIIVAKDIQSVALPNLVERQAVGEIAQAM